MLFGFQRERDVIEFCYSPPDKTSVFYQGKNVEFIRASQRHAGRHGPHRPFLLYVGVLGGYKNFDRFLRAFAQSATEFDLVCFGGQPLLSDELKVASELGLRHGQLTHRGGSDALLAQLNSEAEVIVYQSLYEGFSIPPIEVTPVCCQVPYPRLLAMRVSISTQMTKRPSCNQ